MQSVDRVRKQLGRSVDRRTPAPTSELAREEALLQAVLAGYPDRVAKRRRPKAPDVVFASGGSASLDATSVVHEAELMVAVDAEERRGGVAVRVASQIQPEWLLELSGDLLGDVDALEWNADAKRVDRVTRMTFGNVVLEETRNPAPASEGATKLLAQAALEAGVRTFAEPEAVSAWQCRRRRASSGVPGGRLPHG